MKGHELSPPLQKNYLGWANSLRLDLLALGIDKKNAERILSPLEIAAQIDAQKALEGPERSPEGQTKADEGEGKGGRL
jgi:hypothetical protein